MVRRLEVVERRVSEEVEALQGRLAEMALRLKRLEERGVKEEVREEEVKESAPGLGGKGGLEVQVEVKEEKVKEEVKEREVDFVQPVVVETDDFLSHMQARLAATASLLDQAKRTRRSSDTHVTS